MNLKEIIIKALGEQIIKNYGQIPYNYVIGQDCGKSADQQRASWQEEIDELESDIIRIKKMSDEELVVEQNKLVLEKIQDYTQSTLDHSKWFDNAARSRDVIKELNDEFYNYNRGTLFSNTLDVCLRGATRHLSEGYGPAPASKSSVHLTNAKTFQTNYIKGNLERIKVLNSLVEELNNNMLDAYNDYINTIDYLDKVRVYSIEYFVDGTKTFDYSDLDRWGYVVVHPDQCDEKDLRSKIRLKIIDVCQNMQVDDEDMEYFYNMIDLDSDGFIQTINQNHNIEYSNGIHRIKIGTFMLEDHE